MLLIKFIVRSTFIVHIVYFYCMILADKMTELSINSILLDETDEIHYRKYFEIEINVNFSKYFKYFDLYDTYNKRK